ncbi:MAG: AbrB family transcriptional regulator, partial [Alphaproteobacteria bacterium]|nr:AbrB family transcriptional regulator [Alphaproteobacteria bacterium]
WSAERLRTAIELRLHRRRAIASGLAIAALGGFAFHLLHLPLAWMLGAMCATAVVAIAGAEVRVPLPLRTAMIAVLGVILGSAFSPAMFDDLRRWAAGFVLLALYLALAAGLSLWLFRRIGRFDRPTAYFSAMPGGLSEMVIVGEAVGGHGPTISLVHTVRLLILVLVIPFYFRFVQGLDVPSAPPTGALGDLRLTDAALLLGCGVVGFLIARRLRFPAAGLVGPMVISAAVHLAGLSASRPPVELVAVAQVVVGGAVGCRFSGVALARVWGTVRLAVVSAILMITITVALAALASAASDADPFVMTLALSPGGLAEMSLIALALGADSVFVSTMHILRIAVIMLAAPVAFRLLRHLTDG